MNENTISYLVDLLLLILVRIAAVTKWDLVRVSGVSEDEIYVVNYLSCCIFFLLNNKKQKHFNTVVLVRYY